LGEERGDGGGQGVELGGEGLGVARVSWLTRPLYTADCGLISQKSRDLFAKRQIRISNGDER
jgi:hypothetical protein